MAALARPHQEAQRQQPGTEVGQGRAPAHGLQTHLEQKSKACTCRVCPKEGPFPER